MPGGAHEGMVELLKGRPTLLNDVLAALGRRPVRGAARAVDSALRVANPLEVRPDVVLVDDAGAWCVVEVQLAADDAKGRRWLAAAATLLDTRGVMGDVVVVTHDAAVARWAGVVARVEGDGGTELWLRPVVLRLTLAEVSALLASGRADLAVVAAWAVHDQRGRRAKQLVRRAARALDAEPDPELRTELLRAMMAVLGDELARVVEEMLMTPLKITDSPVYTRLVSALEARGEARGREIGEARGREIGEARGREIGEARALLTLLEARGIALTDADRARVYACGDLAQLERWITRAATAARAGEVFDSPPGADAG